MKNDIALLERDVKIGDELHHVPPIATQDYNHNVDGWDHQQTFLSTIRKSK